MKSGLPYILLAFLCLIQTFKTLQHECLSSVSNIYDEGVINSNLDEIHDLIEQNFDFKITLNSNPIELDKYQTHYLRCGEIVLRRGQYKAAEKIIQIASNLGISKN